jgi:energy-converting hydrogenase Eha subunit A
MLRIALAFVMAPIPAALIQSIIVALYPKDGMGVFEHPASMFVAICILFYTFGIALGIPAVFVMRKRGLRGLRPYALVGVITVLTPILIALAWTAIKGQISVYTAAYNILFFAFGGLIAGWLFWLITRPDQEYMGNSAGN